MSHHFPQDVDRVAVDDADHRGVLLRPALRVDAPEVAEETSTSASGSARTTACAYRPYLSFGLNVTSSTGGTDRQARPQPVARPLARRHRRPGGQRRRPRSLDSVNAQMVAAGLARPYDRGAR